MSGNDPLRSVLCLRSRRAAQAERREYVCGRPRDAYSFILYISYIDIACYIRPAARGAPLETADGCGFEGQ